jgi:hypothetical protein
MYLEISSLLRILMPVEKYFLMAIKDVFIAQLHMDAKSVERLSLNSPIIDATLSLFINGAEVPVYFGLSVNCLDKIHIKMRKIEIENNHNMLRFFLKEIINLLIRQVRGYILELDERTITISEPTDYLHKKQTLYGITRNFSINNEDMIISY